jgi:hypothetical protein
MAVVTTTPEEVVAVVAGLVVAAAVEVAKATDMTCHSISMELIPVISGSLLQTKSGT